MEKNDKGQPEMAWPCVSFLRNQPVVSADDPTLRRKPNGLQAPCKHLPFPGYKRGSA